MAQFFHQLRSRWPNLAIALLAGLVVSGGVLGIRQVTRWQIGFLRVAGLQSLELSAYDHFVQAQPDLGKDSRLLVVGITEADIQAMGQWPIPDSVLADAFKKLQTHQPRVIGLDIWRNLPIPNLKEPTQTNGHAQLVQQMKESDRVVVITKLGSEHEATIPPPTGVPETQVGFNDTVVDSGGVVRRNLLYQEDYFPSFALRMALRYLKDEGKEDKPSEVDPNVLQIGPTVFWPLQSNDGSYINADTRGYQILINYRSAHESVEQVSLSEVLAGQVNPNLIKDRIILMGTTAESGKDLFHTPYSSSLDDRQTMPGVVIHAQMVSQFLDAADGTRNLISVWPEPGEMIWILGWALIGSLLAWGVRHPMGLVLGSGMALIVLYSVCRILFSQQIWIPLVPPFLAFVGATGIVVIYNAQQAQRQQKMVMKLLGQSTSPEIAETLWQRRDELLEDGKLTGQRITATLLFTDLKGFSTISEKMSPEQLLEWLNEYLEAMTQSVQAHHGVINKFTGDGVMAVFGAPIAHEEQAAIARDTQNAVACALDMGKRLDALNPQWQKSGLPAVQMRAGIFTGSVVVGSLGSKTRLEYGVIGDSVNTASRLESFDKQRQSSSCRVLIAKETLEYLDNQFEVENWGTLALKGKVERVDVYRVISALQSLTTDGDSEA
ncbi:CHASE2 domain-containing protein [Acaryochloris marina]|uniref:CHASE2 domain-containing protein n=1 Tax=Acaryochloris marina TaxID=155978 RepID=UPI001BB06C1D|nr:adenylate/guanylate cyclase domain-containing protein [Acaryochloris marina]QUY40662.1 adenylate/guanylate cyclase domain-containing protein [Acaryochloris marina S15]